MTSSWLDLPADHPYGITALPYGVFSGADGVRRVGVRVGDQVLDLGAAAGSTGSGTARLWQQPSLNALLAEGKPAWESARAWVVGLLSDPELRAAVEPHLHHLSDVTLHLPVEVADYVDFYASEHHATNVGRIFRPDGDALTPNWKHLPIGYHGRSGTVVVSGTDIRRPVGQRKPPTEDQPVFGPSVRLDIEAELGFVVAGGTELGSRVSVDEASEHLFGVLAFNDWSARDIQAWEYVPLGPFLGKSFASSVGAWVTPMEALQAAKTLLPQQDPRPMDYLLGDDLFGLDIAIEVELNGSVVARPPYSTMYWSPSQMLAHLTVNGASLRDGDLFASGTVSGPEADQRGSLLELTWSGEQPITLPDGSTRTFLEDGDTVTIRYSAPGADGTRIGLGEVIGTILPAD